MNFWMYVHSSNEDIRQEKNLYPPGGPVWSLKPQKHPSGLKWAGAIKKSELITLHSDNE